MTEDYITAEIGLSKEVVKAQKTVRQKQGKVRVFNSKKRSKK